MSRSDRTLTASVVAVYLFSLCAASPSWARDGRSVAFPHREMNVRGVVRTPGSLVRRAAHYRDALASAPGERARKFLRRTSSPGTLMFSSQQASRRRLALEALARTASRQAEPLVRVGKAIRAMGGFIR